MIDGNYMSTDHADYESDADDTMVPVIVTYGCGCCSTREPATLDNLREAIEYHKAKVIYFEKALEDLKP